MNNRIEGSQESCVATLKLVLFPKHMFQTYIPYLHSYDK